MNEVDGMPNEYFIEYKDMFSFKGTVQSETLVTSMHILNFANKYV